MVTNKIIFNALLYSTTVLLISIIALLLTLKSASAQDPMPFPKPYFDCSEVYDPFLGEEADFHSLRPFQASPCYLKKEDIALYCGNTLVLYDDITVGIGQAKSCKYHGNTATCHFIERRKIENQEIQITGAELPIMGNTEDVKNSQSNTELIPDDTKMNEYVSWYLNGVNYRPEYPYLSLDRDNEPKYLEGLKKIVDFSGPMKKLLPWDIQIDLRTKTVDRTPQAEIDGEPDPENLARHNQIVGCTYGIEVWIPFIGTKTLGGFPAPCYETGWKSAIPRVRHRLDEWEDKIPPKSTDFDDYIDYWKKYQKWRGKICFSFQIPDFLPIIGGLKFVLCGEDYSNPNYYSALFPYIPFSTTEDRLGEVNIKSADVQEASPDMKIYDVFIDAIPAYLFFAHMQEVDELADILQSTFVSKDKFGIKSEKVKNEPTPQYCDIANVRTNPGDKLFATEENTYPDGKWPGGIMIKLLEYTAEFDCEFDLLHLSSCTKTAMIALDTETQTPLADNVWSRLVAGPQSIFKRFYPKIEGNAPIDKILDIPGSTIVNYRPVPDRKLTVIGPNGQRGTPELYFPHIGGIYEYFLHGIQIALRPKGMGSGTIPGIIPTPAPGQCPLGSGPCSVENLLPYFGNNVTYATYASQICNMESGSNPTVINSSCLTGGSVDFSIGLFQINLLAHCADAFEGYTWNPPSCTIKGDGTDCSMYVPGLTNCNARLKQCIELFIDPATNIQKAYSLSSGGSHWSGAWVNAAAKCGIP